uniref:VQ domain-containing protein n=1 Tax=Leersia perrieri TaxID=77586 RepID=A0A0D9XD34_9ORYZ
MDSGNSGGSLQSSSGGDDEFDSRGGVGGVDSSPLSALLRPSPSSSSAAAFSLHGSMYGGFQELGSLPPHQQQQGVSPWSAPQFAAAAPSSSPRVPPGSGAGRTRASRRAPTTVLTTDTSNFRAMVQEFTGIPSPPFVAGVGAPAASLRTRFDHLFPSPASAALRDPASSLPPYLLRPFAQKLPTASSPFPRFASAAATTSTPSSSNIGVASNANATTTTSTAAGVATAATSAAAAGVDTFHHLTPSALLRMQQDATNSSGYLSSFPNVLASSSSQPMFGGFPRLHDASPSPSFSEFLGGGIGLADGGGLISSETLHHHHHHGGDELSGVVASGSGGYGSCKLNYAGASSSSSQAAASADKPPDGAAAAAGRPSRSEGLDPWICTSE